MVSYICNVETRWPYGNKYACNEVLFGGDQEEAGEVCSVSYFLDRSKGLHFPFQTEHLPVLEPQKPSLDEMNAVEKRRSTYIGFAIPRL